LDDGIEREGLTLPAAPADDPETHIWAARRGESDESVPLAISVEDVAGLLADTGVRTLGV
jgi:hypothetical protein